jgi:hypothetical protein
MVPVSWKPKHIAMTGTVFLCTVIAVMIVATAGANAIGDANRELCPQVVEASPGFRTYLPDCRAYEVVTPQFKDGVPFAQSFGRTYTEVAPDGSKVVSPSLGLLAGTGSDQLLGNQIAALYEMTRQNEGWHIESLEPSLNTFGKTEVASMGLNLEKTAWLAPEFKEGGLLLRGPKGEFTEVGPTIPSGEQGGNDSPTITGADEDLSTLLLSVRAAKPGELWDGDITVPGRRSLYFYSGTNQHEPLMVAVRNEGKLQENKDAEPITACGSELGGGEAGSGYNGVSDNGDIIFFTALEAGCGSLPAPEVNEVYARVNGERTLDISEPPLSGTGSIPGRECTGLCAKDEEVTPSSATYQGASSDGSQVFFTSTQPLINSATGGGTYLYEETIAKEGLHSRVVSLKLLGNGGVVGIVRVAADGSRVYFVSTDKLATNLNSVGILNGEEQKAVEGEDNLYVINIDQNQPIYIATLAEADSGDWRNSDQNRTAQASLPDGRFLVFTSHNRLTQDNHSVGGLGQLFEYNAQAGEFGQLNRVSVGYENEGAISIKSEEPQVDTQKFAANGGVPVSQALARNQHLSVTEAGSVFFQSKARLTPLALEGFSNIYEYSDGGVYLISDGQDMTMTPSEENPESVVELISATSSGRDVIFQTADSLVPQDGDTQLDYYDARIEGGFPAPSGLVMCGEDCQGAGQSSPALLTPTSASYSGGSNLSSPSVGNKPIRKIHTNCVKGKKLSHGMCVKDKKKRKKKHGNRKGPTTNEATVNSRRGK